MKRVFRIGLHIVLVVLGGYAFSTALSAALATLLAWSGVLPRGEAVVLGGMLSFVVYLCVVLWAVGERRLLRLAAILSAGALCGAGLAMWLAPLLANARGGT